MKWFLLFLIVGCGPPNLKVCGDGDRDTGINSIEEECDDGNDIEGDGCDTNCTKTACGNGILTTGEVCDDGNTLNGGTCSPSCATQTGIETQLPGVDGLFLAIFDTTEKVDPFTGVAHAELLVVVSADSDLCAEALAAGDVLDVPADVVRILVRKKEAQLDEGFASGEVIDGSAGVTPFDTPEVLAGVHLGGIGAGGSEFGTFKIDSIALGTFAQLDAEANFTDLAQEPTLKAVILNAKECPGLADL